MTDARTTKHSIIAATLTAIALTATGCALPVSSGTSSASPSGPQANVLDAAAITGTMAVLQQVPKDTETDALKEFIERANNSVGTTTATNAIDVGVVGNILKEIEIAKDGTKSPICIAVGRVAIPGATDSTEGTSQPTQSAWVLYGDPGTTETGPLLLLEPGIDTCDKARQASTLQTTKEERGQASNATLALVSSAITLVPAQTLTKNGLVLLDSARGINAATGSPSPSANSTQNPTPNPS